MRTTVAAACLALAVRLLAPEGDVVACTIPDAPASEPTDEGRLLFGGETRRGRALYAMDPDGSDVQRISPRDGRAYLVLESGRWSPDGLRVAWEDRHWRRKEVHVADADGGHARVITDNDHQDNIVGWTPDGRSIVVGRVSSEPGLYLVRTDGSRERRISPRHIEGFPAAEVAPTGRVLLVDPLPTAWSRLYTIDPPWRTADLAMKMRNAPASRTAALSPDGNRFAEPIVVADLRSGERRSIALPGPQPVYDVTYTSARWSPDGGRIAYFASVGTSDTAPFSSAVRAVVATASGDCFETYELPSRPLLPIWSPDGARLAFSMSPPGKPRSDIYVLDLGTGRVVNLTRTPGVDETVSDWAE